FVHARTKKGRRNARADENDRRAEQEVPRVHGSGHGARDERAERRAEDAPRADEPEQALGLARREDAPKKQPETNHEPRREEAGPDVDDVEKRGARVRARGPEPSRDRRRGDERDLDADPARGAARAGAPSLQDREEDADRRDREVNPGKTGRRQAREKEGV